MKYVINCTIVLSVGSDIFVVATVNDSVVSFNLLKLQHCSL